jgi:hypothetical protein
VPAAAVKQEGLAVFIVIGHKGFVDGLYIKLIKSKWAI